MSAERPITDKRVEYLVRESRNILADPERVYDLAGKRYMFRCIELAPFFRSRTFRLGVVGWPNRGKTTFAYSAYRALAPWIPSHYVDLDIYSNSGPAIAGEISWSSRHKRKDAPKRDVVASIRDMKEIHEGLVIADFPGKAENPYQPDRLNAMDMALVLGDHAKDRHAWMQLVTAAGKPFLWLATQEGRERRLPMNPTVYEMNREPKPFATDMLTALTRILETVATHVGVKLTSPWGFFSEPERVVMEEVLDFEFAPVGVTSDT